MAATLRCAPTPVAISRLPGVQKFVRLPGVLRTTQLVDRLWKCSELLAPEQGNEMRDGRLERMLVR
jgi:hypothetical protein